MARGRFLSKSISTDRDANRLDDGAMLAFVMALPHLDRDGLITGDPVLLWAEIAPRRDHWRQAMAGYIAQWCELELCRIYDDASEGPVLFFPNFRKHQGQMRYDRETPSMFAPPPGWVRLADGLAALDVGSESGVSPEYVGTMSGVSPVSRSRSRQDQGQDQGEDQHQQQGLEVGDGVLEELEAALLAVGVQRHVWPGLFIEMPDLCAADVAAWLAYVDELNAGGRRAVIKNPGGFVVHEIRHGRRPEDRYYDRAAERVGSRARVLE